MAKWPNITLAICTFSLIFHKHILVYNFLLKIGVNEETAEKDCCKIEHVISDETAKCLKNYLNNIRMI